MARQTETSFVQKLAVSWVALTPNERKALMLVTGLFLLGVGVRLWITVAA